ncbi:hypothetical protein G7B40_010355 [Aetokthonos hydrillicola Thurmond2011]|jgi:hypothetical protein|uniref:Uncharacterized protein n=1 Tax=Aetokthonos hydrillicola Thurmond2011 TaxID=2712845 RepID=A0AAP5I4N2_9CYAN|nr:hypothetical protein [Aetokthonos hydrillicola]MBO3458970.1 hypothetical protein [Aetokthonos hydrillicola CCALA 1050]MBW4589078.1 hypothetical protein [Aetokthonos hydrillicola CCALA 1050]MDR9894967.1 hypothetical protein [Aetokthonos hydrillicola Thurmond2011]
MFFTNNWQKIFIITGLALCTSYIYPCNVQAKSLPRKSNILIAEGLGGIVRKISIQEVPPTVITGAKTVTNADFTEGRTQIKSDGSLIYIVRGKNQQGFKVEVQSTSSGTIVQVDEEIDSSAIPESVVSVFKRWAPNDKLISTWRSTRLGEFYYQFVIKDVWLEIPNDGNKVVIYRKQVQY